MRSIYWLRNDIRMNENKSLVDFCLESTEGLILWAPTKTHNKLSPFKKESIMQAIENLNEKLKKFDQEIIISNIPFLEILPGIHEKVKFQKLYFTEEYAFNEKNEEEQIAFFCEKHHIQVYKNDQITLVSQKNLPFKVENMPLVFTDFRKKVEAHFYIEKPLASPEKFPKKIELDEDSFGKTMSKSVPLGKKSECHSSEDDLLKRLNFYLWESRSIATYKETRNGLLDLNDSTRFSVGLNIGSISAKTIYHEVKNFEKLIQENESTYWVIFELLWRDYFKFFSLKYGNKIFLRDGINSFGSKKYKFSGSDKAQFLMWCQAQTEDRFINANMNELNATGWMSNRGRQNVASYLIHELKCPWTWGAHYFESKLIDYDPDLNWGNWLYLSGKGSDPRSRIFNCDRQAALYDPEGIYREKWNK